MLTLCLLHLGSRADSVSSSPWDFTRVQATGKFSECQAKQAHLHLHSVVFCQVLHAPQDIHPLPELRHLCQAGIAHLWEKGVIPNLQSNVLLKANNRCLFLQINTDPGAGARCKGAGGFFKAQLWWGHKISEIFHYRIHFRVSRD